MNIREIKFNSSEYNQLLILRDKILRKPLGLQFKKEDLALEVNQHHFACFNENHVIIGGFILVPISKHEIKLRQVCVAEQEQNKGIGKQMMLFAENWAKEKAFSEIYCHARKNALHFYSKLKYKIDGDVFIEVGLEHYKLVKKL